MPPGRIELPTPGLQDQCSNHWAMEAPCEQAAIINCSCWERAKTQAEWLLSGVGRIIQKKPRSMDNKGNKLTHQINSRLSPEI